MKLFVDSPCFDNVTELWLTIVGRDKFMLYFPTQVVEIHKNLAEVVIDYRQKTVTFQLSQEEIQKLCDLDCYAQIRYTTQSGDSYVTEIANIPGWYFSEEGEVNEQTEGGEFKGSSVSAEDG